MADSVDQSTGATRQWELSRDALEGLLLALGTDRNEAGRKYELLRNKLISMFAWSRDDDPEESADETLNRLARRLLQGEPIDKIESYALGIARMLLKESARRREKRSVALREIQILRPGEPGDGEISEALESCVAELSGPDRDLIARYYAGSRATLARELGISANALRTRALRIRRKLYEAVADRLGPGILGNKG